MAETDGRNPDPAVVEIVRAYGARHHETFGDVRIDNGRVVASFTSDVDGHLLRLRQLVADPESVSVELTAYSGVYLDGITRSLEQRVAGDPRRPLRQLARGSVSLRAPFEGLAASLHHEFGAALDITVGAKPYPPTRIRPGHAVAVPQASIRLPGLAAAMHLDHDEVSAGEDLHGIVRLTNEGRRRVAFATGLCLGGIRAQGSRFLAGAFNGWVAPIGVRVDLGPGASCEIGARVGTTSVLVDNSYVVPAGRYEAVVAIPVTLDDQMGRPLPVRQLLVHHGPWVTVLEQ